MSLRPQRPLPPVPDDTARVARAAFPRGNPYVLLRDRLGAVFDDADFADLYPRLGQLAYAPWRLALVTLLQFREGLSDRQAAEAVRARIGWKYLLALDLADPGFNHSVLCEFRGRLLGCDVADRLLARLLDAAREGGLLKGRGRQRTDSTHVLAAIRTLNRVELVAETLRAALNAVAVAAPDWLRALAPPEWHERYDRRVEDMRLPDAGPKRDAYVAQVGADGFLLLGALDGAGAPPEATGLPEVAVLRRVWARHFERVEAAEGDDRGGGARLRPVQGRGPGDRVESPCDTDARFRCKSGRSWTGYVVHLTETCDAGAPRLVVHADTTPANVHEAPRTAPIHDALAARGLAPSEHLVDSAHVSAAHLISARERHGIDLVGPGRRNLSWQSRSGGDAFTSADFAVDWDRQVVRCPEGVESASWTVCAKRRGEGSLIHVQFRAAHCRACPSRARCTRSRSKHSGRALGLLPKPEHEALAAARARQGTAEGRRLYAQRQGVEGTISQGRARLRPAPSALPRLGQDRPAAPRHHRGPEPRPHGGLVRRPTARADTYLAVRRARRLTGDFANRVGFFDSVREAEQTVHHLALDVGGVRGEVYDARRTGELPALRMPGEDSAVVGEAVRRGGAVLHATIPDDRYDAVVRVMEQNGAYDIDERVEAWRREGWSGWSGTAAPTGSTTTTTTTTTAAGTADVAARGGEQERIPVVEERVRVGKQAVQGGRVRVRSYVVETPVQERVTLREERVQVERRPVDPTVPAGDDAFRERVIEATETREEAVVAKEARVVEEVVVVRKEAGERTETVRDTVRRTEVEVEDETGRTGAPGRRDRT